MLRGNKQRDTIHLSPIKELHYASRVVQSIPSNPFLAGLEQQILREFSSLPVRFYAFPEFTGDNTSACLYKEGQTGPTGNDPGLIISVGVSQATASKILHNGASSPEFSSPIDALAMTQAMIAIHEAGHAYDCCSQGPVRWGSRDILDRLKNRHTIKFPDQDMAFRLTKEIIADVIMFLCSQTNLFEQIGHDGFLRFIIQQRKEDDRPDHDTSRYLSRLMTSPVLGEFKGQNLSVSEAYRHAVSFLETNVDMLIDHLAVLTPRPHPVSARSFKPAFTGSSSKDGAKADFW